MGQFRKLKGARIRRSLGLRSERRIFRTQPVEESPRLRSSWRDHRHLRGRGKECDRRRIDHLENVKTESVKRGRKKQETSNRQLPPSRWFPMEKQFAMAARVNRRVHGCALVASATEVMPRSRAALVTAITKS